jgi:hypothetical protein
VKGLRWDIISPVGLLVLALLAVAWLDATKGGEATQKAPLGEIGTPVRNAYVGPTATPFGFVPTRRPTLAAPAGGSTGNTFVRDEKRKSDLLLLLAAAAKVKENDRSYPSTNGNVQSVCNYKDIDVACKIQSIAGDAVADPAKIGYWYSSDGKTAKFYASLEGEVAKDLQCPTTDAELKKHDNLICVTAP